MGLFFFLGALSMIVSGGAFYSEFKRVRRAGVHGEKLFTGAWYVVLIVFIISFTYCINVNLSHSPASLQKTVIGGFGFMIAMITGASLLGSFLGYLTRSRMAYSPSKDEKAAITFTSPLQDQSGHPTKNYILLTCAALCFVVVDRSGLFTKVFGTQFVYSFLVFFTIYYVLVVSWFYYTAKILKSKFQKHSMPK